MRAIWFLTLLVSILFGCTDKTPKSDELLRKHNDVSLSSSHPSVQGENDVTDKEIPPIGSRVRITSNQLGPGWHVGMLNRIRREPVFYKILVFSPSNTITSMYTPDDITRIQVSTIYNTGAGNYDPTKTLYPDEEWIDVSLDALRAANKMFSEKGSTNILFVYLVQGS